MKYVKFSKFIVSTQYGYTAEETSLVEGDAKYLRITDIVPYFVNKEQVPFCKIDDNKKKKYLINENDLLIARTGATTGYNLVVDESYKNFVFASYLIRFNYNKNDLYPLYLKYVLKSQQWYGFVNNFISGSAQPGMNAKAFGKFQIPFFNYDIQKRISNILSTYDKLIDNNNKRIKLLEQMAENLYKEWFVRFRFPGYENVEFNGTVPSGWQYKSISESMIFYDSQRVPLSSMQRDKMYKIYPYYGAAKLMDYVNDYLFDGEYLLMGEDGTVITSGGFPVLQLVNGKFWVNNHAHVIGGKGNISTRFLYLTFCRFPIAGVVTGSAQPKISKGRLEKLKILIPDIKIMEAFNNLINPIFDEINLLKKQLIKLTKQRDMLLPRLMSGKLEV